MIPLQTLLFTQYIHYHYGSDSVFLDLRVSGSGVEHNITILLHCVDILKVFNFELY